MTPPPQVARTMGAMLTTNADDATRATRFVQHTLTVSQLRIVLAVILPLCTYMIDDVLAFVARVQRCKHGAYPHPSVALPTNDSRKSTVVSISLHIPSKKDQ